MSIPDLNHQTAGLRPVLDDPKRRDVRFLIFYIIAIGFAMSISQEETPEVGGIIYWALIVPAVVLPLSAPLMLARSAVSSGLVPLLMTIVGAGWHYLNDDATAAIQFAFFGLWLVWLSSRELSINERDIQKLYLVAFIVGATIWLLTDYNQWGIIPGTTSEAYGIWRVSFFPNIANSAFFSMIVVMIMTRGDVAKIWKKPIFVIAAYFVIFTFVRSVLVGIAMYAVMRAILIRYPSRAMLFWLPLTSAFAINIFIAYSPAIFASLQNSELISRLFLRGETGISADEIYTQLYRPWIWREHFLQFVTSPYLMGWGSLDFNILKSEDLVPGLDQSGTVSLLTRLIATFGLPGMLFTIIVIAHLWILARKGDVWGCSLFPAIFLSMMQWGSIFHPTDGLGAILMLVMLRGSEAISFLSPQASSVLPRAPYQLPQFAPVTR